MQLSEVRIAFPLAFLESLLHQTSGSKQNTRHFSASVSKPRRHKNDNNHSDCDIDANFTDLIVQLCLKSESFTCDNKSISCNIIDWDEIVDIESKGRKRKTKSRQTASCSKARKQKTLKNENDVGDCQVPESECNRSISYYLEKNVSPKRKLVDTDREHGKRRRLSDVVTVHQTNIENNSNNRDNTFELNNGQHDNDSKSDGDTGKHDEVNKHDHENDDKVQNGSTFQFVADCVSHSDCETVSVTGERTRKTSLTASHDIIYTDKTYLQISEVMQHIDINDLKVNASSDSCPEQLKPVSLGTIDLRVSSNFQNHTVKDNEIVVTEKELSANTHDELNTEINKSVKSKVINVENVTSESKSKVMASLNLKKTPPLSGQMVKDVKSTLLVEEGKTPLFYIHSKTADLHGCVLLGPFVLQSSPVPHLRLTVAGEIGKLVPSHWTWREQVNKDPHTTPSRKQTRRRSKTADSPKNRKVKSNKQLRQPAGEDGDPSLMAAGEEKQMQCVTSQTHFQPVTPKDDEDNGDADPPADAVSLDSDEERAHPSDLTLHDDACPDKLVIPEPTHRPTKTGPKPKTSKTEPKTKSSSKTEASVDCEDENTEKERPWDEQDGADAEKLEAVTETNTEVTKREIGPNSPTKRKLKQKKKKKKLPKRGIDAMYKRLESYCIKIVPETGSDLWGPVSDPIQIHSSCKFCTKSFPDPLLLADHTRNIHKSQPQYMDFVRENRCKMKLKCNLCVEDRFYGRWESFGQHMRDIHTEKLIGESVQKIKCTLCDKTWVNQNKYDRHLKAAHGSERYLCHLCPATFKWESSLQCHIKGIHEKEMDHSCEICGATFSRKSYVKNHIRKTHSEKGHGGVRRSRGIHCSLCDLRLDKKKDITKHLIEVHQMDRTCKMCKVKFDTDEEMDKHTRDFHGNALCQHCPYCGSGFQARDNMLRHIAKDHLKIMQPKCPLCEKQFDYNTDLRFHLKKDHSYGDQDHTYGQAESLKSIAILKCEHCDKPFFWVMGMINHILASHMDKFPHECKECRQRFLEASSLQHHMAFRHMTITQGRGHGSGRRGEGGGKKQDGKEKLLKTPKLDHHQDLLQKGKEGRGFSLLTGKEMPMKPKDGTVKVISGNMFPPEDGAVPVSVPDIHGGFMSGQMDRRSTAYSSAERWTYPANQWPAHVQQNHTVTMTGQDFLNSDAVVRPEETLYHMMNYAGDNQDVRADPSGMRTQLPGIRDDHVTPVTSDHVTPIGSDHVSVRSIEQIPLSTTEHVPVQNTEHVPERSTEHLPVRTTQYVPIRPKIPGNMYQEQPNRRPGRLAASQRIVMAANERARMQAAVDRGIIQGASERVLLQGVTDQRLVHGTSDRIVVPGPGDRGIVHGAAVHAGVHGSGGDGQVITADNLIGLLSEFNSQQQSNPYFQTQFF